MKLIRLKPSDHCLIIINSTLPFHVISPSVPNPPSIILGSYPPFIVFSRNVSLRAIYQHMLRLLNAAAFTPNTTCTQSSFAIATMLLKNRAVGVSLVLTCHFADTQKKGFVGWDASASQS